ncbi:hypothetical protein MACH07_07110 [Flagellimonas marinaquae]|uniref:Lipocalin-like domain-containing protein n=1 Tax=Flagellimonas marinaquae TaxID=254955 RepID=A0AA48KL84_9FLAO|nr:hypothetical protein MACH07_07110 [Allomuricauda aquimarina]
MKYLKICLLTLLLVACSKDDATSNLSLDEQLVGKWTMTNYYDDTFFVEYQNGVIEKIVPEETNYAIEFTDNPKEIKTIGFLRYSREEYEIVDGEKVITGPVGTNFMDGDDGEGYHTGTWKIENGKLITTGFNQIGPDEFEEFSIISTIQLKGNVLTLTLDNAQFGSHLTGEIIIEYKRQ